MSAAIIVAVAVIVYICRRKQQVESQKHRRRLSITFRASQVNSSGAWDHKAATG
jgi:hypothetical protein